jgi:small basic protein
LLIYGVICDDSFFFIAVTTTVTAVTIAILFVGRRDVVHLYLATVAPRARRLFDHGAYLSEDGV